MHWNTLPPWLPDKLRHIVLVVPRQPYCIGCLGVLPVAPYLRYVIPPYIRGIYPPLNHGTPRGGLSCTLETFRILGSPTVCLYSC